MPGELNRLCWLDMEMSGLVPDSDRVLELALLVTDSDLNHLSEGKVLVVHQPDEVLDAMDSWNKSVHGKSGLIERVRVSALNEAQAEAAAIEGASRWTFFRRVQWPLLMPTTLFVLVNAVINAFRMVDHIFILTRGGPDNASTLLLYHLYEVGFRFWDTGYAAAITVVLVAVLGSTALFQFFVLDKRVHYK